MRFESMSTNFLSLITQFFRGYYHMYFLYIILGLSLITPLLYKALSIMNTYKTKLLITCLFLIAMAMTTIKGFLIPSINIFETTFTYFIPYIAYYLVGLYSGKLEISSKNRISITIIYVVTLISTILLNYWYMLYVGWQQGYYSNFSTYFYFFEYFSPTVIIMSICVYLLAFKRKYVLPINIVRQLSSAAFGVYLIHPMIIDILNKYTLFDLSRIPSPVFAFMIIKSLIVILTSYTVVILLRKVNLFQYLDGSR